jgi:glucose dehydrogenase
MKHLRSLMAASVAALLGMPALAAGPTDSDLVKASGNNREWLIYGRTYDNQRFSPLTGITPANVRNLRPVWAASLGTLDGLEATPLVHEGVIYVTAAYAQVSALDARNGRLMWRFVPEQPEGLGTILCCGPVNRGVAIYGDLVYVLTLDAKLVALNRRDGKPAWTQTIGDWKAGISATGAPYVVKGMVIAGMAGGEYGARGYVKAYGIEPAVLGNGQPRTVEFRSAQGRQQMDGIPHRDQSRQRKDRMGLSVHA